MTPRTADLNQVATYWAPGVSNGFGGVTFAAPVAIACRWQDKADLFRDAQGQETVSSAVVYVDRVLAIKGKIALGDFTDEGEGEEGDEGEPVTPHESAKEIRNFGSSPSIDADETLLKVWL